MVKLSNITSSVYYIDELHWSERMKMFDLFFSFTDVATVKRTKKREGTRRQEGLSLEASRHVKSGISRIKTFSKSHKHSSTGC